MEFPATISHVERYHAPVRESYTYKIQSLPRTESDEECLHLAVKVLNDTI